MTKSALATSSSQSSTANQDVDEWAADEGAFGVFLGSSVS
jgi:hypothetical protein